MNLRLQHLWMLTMEGVEILDALPQDMSLLWLEDQ
jgi:hypothetical protein